MMRLKECFLICVHSQLILFFVSANSMANTSLYGLGQRWSLPGGKIIPVGMLAKPGYQVVDQHAHPAW